MTREVLIGFREPLPVCGFHALFRREKRRPFSEGLIRRRLSDQDWSRFVCGRPDCRACRDSRQQA